MTSLLRELRSRPDRALALQHDHLAPGEREGARDREADHAGADHDGIKMFGRHHA